MASSEDSCRRATSFAGPDRRQLSGATMGTDESAAERGPAALATRPSMSAICWRRVRMRSRSSRGAVGGGDRVDHVVECLEDGAAVVGEGHELLEALVDPEDPDRAALDRRALHPLEGGVAGGAPGDGGEPVEDEGHHGLPLDVGRGRGRAASGDATGGGEAEVPATTLPCASSTADVLTSWKSATSCRTPSSSTSTSEGRRSRTIRPFLSRTTKSTATSAAVTGMTGGAAGACAPPVGGTATATARTKASVRKVDPPAPRDALAEMLPDRGARIRPVPQGAIVTFAQRTALSTPSATVTRSS